MYKLIFKTNNIFPLNETDGNGELIDKRSFEAKFNDFTCIDNRTGELYLYYGLYQNINKTFHVLKKSPALYAEFYLSKPNDGQNVITNGFLLHMIDVMLNCTKIKDMTTQLLEFPMPYFTFLPFFQVKAHTFLWFFNA